MSSYNFKRANSKTYKPPVPIPTLYRCRIESCTNRFFFTDKSALQHAYDFHGMTITNWKYSFHLPHGSPPIVVDSRSELQQLRDNYARNEQANGSVQPGGHVYSSFGHIVDTTPESERKKRKIVVNEEISTDTGTTKDVAVSVHSNPKKNKSVIDQNEIKIVKKVIKTPEEVPDIESQILAGLDAIYEEKTAEPRNVPEDLASRSEIVAAVVKSDKQDENSTREKTGCKTEPDREDCQSVRSMLSLPPMSYYGDDGTSQPRDKSSSEMPRLSQL